MSPRIGVLGGSFDPVHDAHVEVARRALAQVPCDEIWFLPAARAVHKPGGARARARDRRAMIEIAIDGIDGFSLCTAELDHGTARRSLETMCELRERWPGRSWCFILGEDSFAALHAWHRPVELLRIARPVVAPRPGSGSARDSEWRGIPVTWLAGDAIDLDSTSIREALAAGKEPAGLDARVLDYIRAHGLYRGGAE